MIEEDVTRSIAREMLQDLKEFDDLKLTVDQLAYRLKARLALLADARADDAWVDELRSLRNEIEVVSAFFIESGRPELTEGEQRQLADIVGELREALVEY